MVDVPPYVKSPLVFGPEATRGMSVAFDEVCRILPNIGFVMDCR